MLSATSCFGSRMGAFAAATLIMLAAHPARGLSPFVKDASGESMSVGLAEAAVLAVVTPAAEGPGSGAHSGSASGAVVGADGSVAEEALRATADPQAMEVLVPLATGSWQQPIATRRPRLPSSEDLQQDLLQQQQQQQQQRRPQQQQQDQSPVRALIRSAKKPDGPSPIDVAGGNGHFDENAFEDSDKVRAARVEPETPSAAPSLTALLAPVMPLLRHAWEPVALLGSSAERCLGMLRESAELRMLAVAFLVWLALMAAVLQKGPEKQRAEELRQWPPPVAVGTFSTSAPLLARNERHFH